MYLSRIPSGNDPFIIKSPPEGSAIQFRCFRNPANSPPGMYKKPGNIMEQKLPTSLNLNMVSWTRISGLHQQQQYLDLASKHSEVNTVSTWTGAEGSIDPWMLLSEAEEQLFPRWAWKMVPYIYVYIYVTNWSEENEKDPQQGRLLDDFLTWCVWIL